MNFFDLHNDLIYRMVKESQGMCNNNFHVDFSRIKNNDIFVLCCAIWVPDDVNNFDFFEICKDKFFIECEKNNIKIYNDFSNLEKFDKTGVILSMENSRLLNKNNYLEKVKYLSDLGVKMITLTWNGSNELGDGAGVENSKGLSDFGKKLVKELEKNKIIIDLSHASEKLFYDVIEICDDNSSIICSHSNSKEICDHKRNITREQFEIIKNKNGLLGLNFCKDFLNNFDDIYKNIDYFLSLGGENNLSFGSDFDGCELVENITGIEYIENLYNYFLVKNYKENLLNKIFFSNSGDFMIKNLK